MRIIPAIDIIDGKCVRLTQGDYAQKKIYNENVLEVAKSFEDAGLNYLHVVDLDGAKAGKVVNWKVLEDISSCTKLKIDFGGGIKTDLEIERLFQIGVKQVNLGSIAVKNPEKVKSWIDRFGSGKIILSADVKNEMIAISGWQEDSKVSISELITEYVKMGLSYVTCTDISTDGMLSGPNLLLYQKLLNLFPGINLIASGGVSSVDDLHNLKESGVDGVIIGKAIYEGKVTLSQLAEMNTGKNLSTQI
jgi:phosphoribosylformimino-5-aminoimidazole carboxamide ribotide isomerase